MLRIGLTGGIGAGKSAASTALAELGAIVVDADKIAREVVEPGTPGLAAVVEEFGPGVLTPEGALNRPALGAIVFNDEPARKRLNAILHPRISARSAELHAQAPAGGIVVHDNPLLIESFANERYHLVVIVMATVETRLARLTGLRGMTEADARARIAAQATDEQRIAAADVLLDNDGSPEQLRAGIEELWKQRLVPYAANMQAETPAALPERPGPADPTWSTQFARAAARLRRWLDDPDLVVEHVGPTADPPAGEAVLDVLDLRLHFADDAALSAAAERLPGSGWVVAEPVTGEAGVTAWSADPGRPARLFLGPA